MTSSAYFPPEMARLELDKLDGRAAERVTASAQFEIWSVGLLLPVAYQLL